MRRGIIAALVAVLGASSAYAQVPSYILQDGPWYRGSATLDLDFVHDQYWLNGTNYADNGSPVGTALNNFISGAVATFTRAGTTNVTTTSPPLSSPFFLPGYASFVSRADATPIATYFNSSGVLTTVGTAGAGRTAAYYYNGSSWVNGGTLAEPAATNSIRNNAMSGALAGTPGTLPTNWSIYSLPSGISYSVIGSGTSNGISYVDVQFSGTAATSGDFGLFFDTSAGIAATVGQTWTLTTYTQIVGGSLANINTSGSQLAVNINKSGGSYSSYGSGLFFTPSTNALQTQHLSYTFTVSDTKAAYVQPLIFLVATTAGPINVTLRIGMPQLEQSSYATSVIATSGSAVTRAADVYAVPSGGTYFDGTGTLQQAAANSPRLDYGSSGGSNPHGILIEESRTNNIRNNTMVGAVAADGIERTNNGTFSTSSGNACTGSTTSSGSTLQCASGTVAAQAISSITYSTTTATVTTASAHGLAIGDVVSITGASPAAYNGSFMVASVPTTTTFTYTMASNPGSNATSVGSYVASNYYAWVGTVNGGTGTVTAASGSMTLTGDGTNAASIYEAIPTTSGYYYTIAVTNGSGNAVTVQAGATAGASSLLAANSIPVSSTIYYQFTATGSTSYVQINNTSTTAATVTLASVQSAGAPPTGWSFDGDGAEQQTVGIAIINKGIVTANAHFSNSDR